MSDMSAPRALSSGKRFAYSVGNFGVGSLPAIVGSWAMYYYAPPSGHDCLKPYVAVALIGLMLGLGRVAEAILNPFIGDWSDKTKSRHGRRIPYIVVGTPIMTLGAVLIWFPPIDGVSLINTAWVGFWMTVMSCAFAAVVAPYLSLLPELTPHRGERITLSVYMALFETLGVLAAAAGAGAIIGAYICGVSLFGVLETNGFQIAGVVFGVITLAAFWTTGFGVKEKDFSPRKEVSFSFKEGVREVFKNKPFIPYLALVTAFRIAIDTIVVVIPYVVTTVMGGVENDAVIIQIIVLVGAVLLFPLVNWLAVKYGKKAVTLAGCVGFTIIMPSIFLLGSITAISPMVQGYILFAFATFPVAVFNITPRPHLADIIDHDETVTGFRREAIYNGVEGLFTRSASGFAWVLCSALFALFGNSAENPMGILLTGPVGGAFVLIGMLWFMKYPFKE